MKSSARHLMATALAAAVSLPWAFAAEQPGALPAALHLYDLLKIAATVKPAMDQYADELALNDNQRADLYTRYRREVGALMAQVYDPGEIAALTEFYSSPIGQSVIAKQAEIGDKYTQALIKVLSTHRLELGRQRQP